MLVNDSRRYPKRIVPVLTFSGNSVDLHITRFKSFAQRPASNFLPHMYTKLQLHEVQTKQKKVSCGAYNDLEFYYNDDFKINSQ